MKSLDSLSEVKKKQLRELRCSLEDLLKPHHDDYVLLKWLSVKSFDVKEAERALRLDINGKHILGADSILEDFVPHEVLQKYTMTGFLGFDYEGHAVRYFNIGCCDMKGIIDSVSTTDILRYSIYIIEHDIDLMRKENEKVREQGLQEEFHRRGRTNDQVIYICDYETFTMGQILHKSVIETTILGLKLYQAHFPETAKMFYIIKAPTYFTVAYNMFKPFIFQSMRQKLRVFGREHWLEELLQIMDPSILPASLGGTRIDPDGDPKCSSIITYGGKIPSTYHFAPGLWMKADDPGVTSITVQRRSFHDVKQFIRETNSKFRWHIQSSDHDLELVIFFKEFRDDEMENEDTGDIRESDFQQLIPTIRIQCQLVPEMGETDCLLQGLYVLRINNFFSWFNDKHVMYRTEVISPSTEDQENPF